MAFDRCSRCCFLYNNLIAFHSTSHSCTMVTECNFWCSSSSSSSRALLQLYSVVSADFHIW